MFGAKQILGRFIQTSEAQGLISRGRFLQQGPATTAVATFLFQETGGRAFTCTRFLTQRAITCGIHAQQVSCSTVDPNLRLCDREFFCISARRDGLIVYMRCNFSSFRGGSLHCVETRYPENENRRGITFHSVAAATAFIAEIVSEGVTTLEFVLGSSLADRSSSSCWREHWGSKIGVSLRGWP